MLEYRLKMRTRIITPRMVTLLLIVGVAAVPVFAASETFREAAEEYYQRHCTGRNVRGERAMLCYLFERVRELGSDLDQLAERVQGLEANQGDISETLAMHETRLQALEAALHTHPPSPTPPSNCAAIVSSQPIVEDDFNGYTDGSIVGQGSWESYANGDNFVVQGAVVNEGAKALHVNASADSIATKRGVPRADGKQAVCIRTENRSQWGFYLDGNAQFRVTKNSWAGGTDIFAAVSFKSDGNVAYYDVVNDVYQNFATYNDNEWTLLEIEWRSSDKTARYRVNNGAWAEWKTFSGAESFTDFDYVGFDFVLPSGSGGVYFDTLR